MAKLQQILDRTNVIEMQNIIDKLQEGKKHAQYSIDKDVILILGKAGSGKTILTQFIAENEDLVSEKLEDSLGYYIQERNQTTQLPLDNWQTFVPQLVRNTKTNTIFYDCPGFLNAINEVNDISAGYYIKDIIDSSGSVKLVFTITHDSLLNEKVFLSQLVKPAIKLIKNIEKFKNSIALVVTKVVNQKEFRINHDKIPDESIIRDIGDFLQNLADELERHVANGHLIYPKEIYSDGLAFIKTLLHINIIRLQKFPKIGIFRMPTSSGQLSNMTLLQKNKESLKKLVSKDIQFSPHNDKDFGYSISSESILYIKSLANKINEEVATEIRNIGHQIEQQYHNQEEQTHDIKTLCDELHSSHKTLLNMQSGIFGFSEPQQLVTQITKNVNDLNMGNNPNLTFDRIVDYAEYIIFLRNLVNNESTLIDPYKWAHAMTDILKYLDDSYRWYNFLNNLPIFLSKYDVQRNLTQYADTIGILQSSIANSDHYKHSIIESLKVLLYKINKDDFERELIEIKDVSLDNNKLKHLTCILNLTLKNDTTSSWKGDKLIIKSRYVKLSDIVNVDFTHAKAIEILALKKVFLDINLNMTADLSQIFIISPEWEIIGNPEIRLNNKSEFDNNVKSFAGIGQHFHGYGYLTISTKEGSANNERWFGTNVKVTGEKEPLVNNDKDFLDTENVKIVKLLDSFDFSANGLKGEIQFNNSANIRVHSAVSDFKCYVRESLSNEINFITQTLLKESSLRSFVKLLENHRYVKDSYSPLGFINELHDIEDQIFTLDKHISFQPYYQSFLHSLNEYAENNNQKLTNDDKKVLSFLNAVTMSKIYCNNDDIPDYFVNNIKDSLQIVHDDIEKLTQSNNLNDTVFINDCRLNEQKLIEEASSVIHNFIEMRIRPNMDISFSNRNKLSSKELIKLKLLSSISEKLTDFFDFINLMGSRASSIIQSSTKKESLELNYAKIYDMYPITDLLTTVQNFDLKLKNQFENKKLLIKDILFKIGQKLTLFLTKHPSNELSMIEAKISEKKQRLNEKITDPFSMDNIQKEIAELLQKQKESLEKKISQKYEGFEDQLNFVKRMIKIINMARLPADFYNEIKSDETKINNFWETIEQAEDNLKQLLQFEKHINDMIMTAHKSINNNVKETENVLKIRSYAALTVTKWQMQMTLKNLLHKLQNFKKSYTLPEHYGQYIVEFEKSTVNLIRMYNQLEYLCNKIQWVVHVVNIKSSKETKIKLHSKTLNTAINKLKLIMQSNLVLKKKDSAVSIFKQHMYPDSSYFFGAYHKLLSAFQITDRNSSVSNAARSLYELRWSYIISRSYKPELIEITYSKSRSNDEFAPLFRWDHSRNKKSVSNLFEGKEIPLTSNVQDALKFMRYPVRSAIKFNEVRINFKVANETMQTELNKDLENYRITMKHSGKSYYRCYNQIHVIPSDSFTIIYSLAKNKDGNPLKTNDVYDKLKKHEPVLSPFTTWHIQLSNINGDDFSSLARYRDEVIDLELEAKMDFLWTFDGRIEACNDDLNNYYTLYDKIPSPNYTSLSNRHKREIPEIQSSTRSSYINGQNPYRKRRGVFGLITNDEQHKHATSGAVSSTKSSITHNVVDIIGTHLVALRYWNPFDKIINWFANDNKNIIPEESHVLSHILLENRTSTIRDAFGYSSLCNHGNLLLFDLMIRHKNGIKYKHQGFEIPKVYNCEYAQNLAYREYVPNNCNG